MFNQQEMLNFGNKSILWSFSSGKLHSKELKEIIQSIPSFDGTFDNFPANEAGVIQIKQIAEKHSPENIQWFDIGVNSILVANLASSNAPAERLDAAIMGFRSSLEQAEISIKFRDIIDAEIATIKSGVEDADKALTRLQELLRELARKQDEKEGNGVKKQEWLTENQKWFIGIIIPLIFAGSAPAWWSYIFP